MVQPSNHPSERVAARSHGESPSTRIDAQALQNEQCWQCCQDTTGSVDVLRGSCISGRTTSAKRHDSARKERSCSSRVRNYSWTFTNSYSQNAVADGPSLRAETAITAAESKILGFWLGVQWGAASTLSAPRNPRRSISTRSVFLGMAQKCETTGVG